MDSSGELCGSIKYAVDVKISMPVSAAIDVDCGYSLEFVNGQSPNAGSLSLQTISLCAAAKPHTQD